MKLVTGSLLFALICPVVLAGSQPPDAPFTLTLTSSNTSVAVGSDVYVKIAMTNTSDHDIDCTAVYVGGLNLNFKYDVRDLSGKSRKKLDIHPEKSPGSMQMCTLEPGQTTTSEVRLSWTEDFSEPGDYSIQVERAKGETEKDGTIKSNKIALHVFMPQ